MELHFHNQYHVHLTLCCDFSQPSVADQLHCDCNHFHSSIEQEDNLTQAEIRIQLWYFVTYNFTREDHIFSNPGTEGGDSNASESIYKTYTNCGTKMGEQNAILSQIVRSNLAKTTHH
jgi:hypothetical protein